MKLGKFELMVISITIIVVVFLLVKWGDKPALTILDGSEKKTATTCDALVDGFLPDPKCTPGAVNHAVTQATIKKTICVTGWTDTIRPSTSYTTPLKYKSMRQYGYTDSPGNYEFDHLIPLTLGGSPDSIKNLWPEAHKGIFGSYVKDGWERRLNNLVCDGRMKLAEARKVMAKGGWVHG